MAVIMESEHTADTSAPLTYVGNDLTTSSRSTAESNSNLEQGADELAVVTVSRHLYNGNKSLNLIQVKKSLSSSQSSKINLQQVKAIGNNSHKMHSNFKGKVIISKRETNQANNRQRVLSGCNSGLHSRANHKRTKTTLFSTMHGSIKHGKVMVC